MANPRGRSIDVMRRDDRRLGLIERCEVIKVYPHVAPSPAFNGNDVNYNCVDVQLIDRIPPTGENDKRIVLRRVPVMQREHGLFQGTPWTPRIGDMVVLFWMADDAPLILGTFPAFEQEPVCRSEADEYYQEEVHKRTPWELPAQDDYGNFVEFPMPEHPDCSKWWPKTRDSILIHDCPYGHTHPQCDANTPCTELDDLQSGTWLKIFSDISPTILDKTKRIKFHHVGGSVLLFDDDGHILIVSGWDGAAQGGHIKYYPETESIDLHASPIGKETEGAQLLAVGKSETVLDTDNDSIAIRTIWKDTDSYIEILKNGSIKIKSNGSISIAGGAAVTVNGGTSVTLTAPTINLSASSQINLTAPDINISEGS